MPKYRYEVIDKVGKVSKGVFEATTQAEATRALRADGRFITSLSQDRGSSLLNAQIGSQKLKIKDLLVICRQMSSLLSAGITIVRALDMLYQQLESKRAKAVIGQVYENIQAGKTLSEAFREQGKALPDIMISMIAAGEEAGQLDEVMERLAVHFEKENKMRNRLINAMIYPIILLLITVGITLALMVFVVPTFAEVLTDLGTELPLITEIVLGISNFLVTYWYLVVGLIIIVFLLARAYIRSEKGALVTAKRLLKVPLASKAIKATAAARFTRTMSTMLRSGINVLEALNITSHTLGNKYLESRLNESKIEIRKGNSLSRSVRSITEFPPMIFAMIAIGEESGTLDTILDRAADYFEEEADSTTAKVMTALEPIMIVLMAGLVGTIVVACGAPILSLYGSI